ncbi:hypothetical protein JTB14_032566 [Gonioctena quinquepunctata]|nr:hypothetical protein JTB14_032566 [Gonioctena quinquepunctata]
MSQTFEDPFEKNSYFHWMEIIARRLPQTTPPGFEDDCPASVGRQRPWCVGHLGRQSCANLGNILPLWDVELFSGLFLGQSPGSVNNKSSDRGPRRISLPPTGSRCYRQGCP